MGQLKKLVELQHTGTPKELAQIFNVSERTIRRMIQNLRQGDCDVEFCRRRNSYIFKK
ncbi:MAG TPA: HTH domain-containing protein [Bacteroidia bacterium]|nr:HTH domain-containing protein [Bacteroidia bacterium]